MKARTSIIIDTRRPKKDGLYPVKLRITYNRKQKYYPTDFDMSETEFNEVYQMKPKKAFVESREKLDDIEADARKIINSLPVFTFKKFENEYQQYVKSPLLEDYYNRYIKDLEDKDSIKTAVSYRCSINSLINYSSKNLKIDDITVDFLKGYEKWMIKNNKSFATIGIYLRPLRAILNKAIKDGNLHADLYPFGRDIFQIKKAPKTKKALKPIDIQKLYNYKTSIAPEKMKAKDFWFFSYLSNGINFKDIANLKYKNIEGEYCNFIREKTKYTSSEVIKISFYLLPDIKKIIRRWGNKNKEPDDYIFPILRKGMSAKDKYKRIDQFIRTTNHWLEKVSKDLELEIKLTTYVARHSFATHLKNKNISIEYISEQLGHSNIYTTKAYLDSFPDEQKKSNAEELLKF